MLPTTARIQKENPLPRHIQVRQILLDMVARGMWEAGEKIPAETEIAEHLGVSKMTVNKAILALTSEGFFLREVGRGTFVSLPNDRAIVSGERLDAHTLQTVEVITLRPPEMASDNEYLCSLMLAMRCAVSPMDVRLVLRQSDGKDYLSYWREGRSDGWLIISPLEDTVPGLSLLAEAGAKAVVVGANWPEMNLPFVDSDNQGGAAAAVDHLVSLGHSDIGIIYASLDMSNTQDRVRGFQDSMRRYGLPVRSEWVIDSGEECMMSEQVRNILRKRLSEPGFPTAIVAAGALVARDLLQVVQEAGHRVPEELSIVAFDDPSAIASITPQLTTVRQPLEEMGQQAIAILCNLISSGGEAPKQRGTILPCRLLLRDSTASPGFQPPE